MSLIAELVESTVVMSRTWAMPSPHTFSIPPIAVLLSRYLQPGVTSVDPFCGQARLATWNNDLNPALNDGVSQDAETFCVELATREVGADVILFDPPYSPRQISEVYKSVGLKVGAEETQNSRLYKRTRDALDALLKPGGIAISCGWNSAGFGKTRGYEIIEILLVAHGGAHNDTIVTVEQKRAQTA